VLLEFWIARLERLVKKLVLCKHLLELFIKHQPHGVFLDTASAALRGRFQRAAIGQPKVHFISERERMQDRLLTFRHHSAILQSRRGASDRSIAPDKLCRVTLSLPPRKRRDESDQVFEAEAPLDFRFPRFKRKELESRFSHLASQLIECQSLADDAIYCDAEPFSVGQFAIVVAICLLVQIAEQVEWFDAYVCAIDTALQQAPEIFKAVCMDVAFYILNGMVNYLMRVVASEPVIGQERIGVESGTCFDMIPDFCLKRLLLAIRNHDGAYLPATLKNSHDCGLVLTAGSGDATLPLADVHIASLPADEGFVRFDVPRQFVSRRHSKRAPNPVIHKPCGFLGDAASSCNLVAADAVLAVHNLPHSEKPLVQAERRILKDRASLGSELSKRVLAAALPAVVLRLEQDVLAATTRTDNAIRPAVRYQVFAAVVRGCEVKNRGLQCVRFHA
jgi:hypothetical protein